MKSGINGGARLAVLMGLVVSAGQAGAIEPEAVEAEIRSRMLSGAASEIHLRQVPPDRIPIWREAAEAGDPACQWLIGRCFQHGWTVPSDPVEAAKWYRKAADQGYARAQLSLGLALAAGRGVPRDLAEAVRLYQRAADQPSCPEAYEWLILAHNRGYGVPKDPARAKELVPRAVAAYRALADKGYAGARMRLARILTTGTWGTPVDLRRGLELYHEGLAQGHVYCQTNLGHAYTRGEYGLPKDLARGINYFRLAAAQGDSISARSLAEMYLDGEIHDPDPAEADRIYPIAAAEFRASAEEAPEMRYRLAQMVERGAGVPRDDAEAVSLYRMAAEAGSAPAALALADRYDSGRGVPRDPAEAARWRDRAKLRTGD